MSRVNLPITRAKRLVEALQDRIEKLESGNSVIDGYNAKIIFDVNDQDRDAVIHIGISNGVIAYEDYV